MDKKILRKKAYKYFLSMSDDIYLERNKEILEYIIHDERFLSAQKIALYYPIKKEINLLSLMVVFPSKEYFFPRMEGNTLSFRKVNNLSELEDAKFNLKEPKNNALVEENIDLYFVPCLLTSGNFRIGYGKGYYDNYFKNHQGFKVGIVHKELKNVSAKIDSHDVPMDFII
ncbi:MAG: 5-formyltetrahydrofolate cyclo-ligase [Acholeplasmatales bacterium]